MPYTYEYPRPALTVDCVVFGFDGGDLKVLLIQRKSPPYEDYWALPGGFVDMGEPIETAALRELEEETGVKNLYLEQLYTFGKPGRDPRGRVISVAYYALVKLVDYQPNAGDDAKAAQWFSVLALPPLAFDHELIMDTALKRLRGKIRYQPIGFELLPEKFPLSELRKLYITILSTNPDENTTELMKSKLDKWNFRKKMLRLGILKPLDEYQQGVPHRAAQLYSFDKEKYLQQVESEGIDFEI